LLSVPRESRFRQGNEYEDALTVDIEEQCELRRPRTRTGTDRDRTRIENRVARIETRSSWINEDY
jgi:3-phenylpropionate/cinnamic acid dioxygenase small subunit